MPTSFDMLAYLQSIIQDRKVNPVDRSYTTDLFDQGVNQIAQKVGEEAVEVVVAALGQERDEQIGELADLFYHALVLMSALDLTLEDIYAELERRHRK